MAAEMSGGQRQRPSIRLVRVTDRHSDVVYDPQRQPVLHRLASERRVRVLRAQATRRAEDYRAAGTSPRPTPFLSAAALMFALFLVLAVAVWP